MLSDDPRSGQRYDADDEDADTDAPGPSKVACLRKVDLTSSTSESDDTDAPVERPTFMFHSINTKLKFFWDATGEYANLPCITRDSYPAVKAYFMQKYNNMRKNIDTFVAWQTKRAPYAIGFESTDDIAADSTMSVYVHFLDFGCRCTADGMGILNKNQNGKGDPPQLRSVLYRSDNCITASAVLKTLDLKRCVAFVCTDRKILRSLFSLNPRLKIPRIECAESVLTRCLEGVFKLPCMDRTFMTLSRGHALIRNKSMLPFAAELKFDWCESVLASPIRVGADAKYKAAYKRMKDLIAHIKPLKLALETLANEPLSLCTIVRPVMVRLQEILLSCEHFDHNIISINNLICAELYNSILADPWFEMVTYMDLRFPRAVEDADVYLICLIRDSRNARAAKKVHAQREDKRKSNLRAFFASNNAAVTADAAAPQTPDKELDNEFERFHMEQTLSLDECPVRWWRDNATCYPRLHYVAERYLCVPSCVNRQFRYTTEERFNWRQKRYQMWTRSPILTVQWYLHYNADFYKKLRMCQINEQRN